MVISHFLKIEIVFLKKIFKKKVFISNLTHVRKKNYSVDNNVDFWLKMVD